MNLFLLRIYFQDPRCEEKQCTSVLAGSGAAWPKVLLYSLYSRNCQSTPQVQINLNKRYFSFPLCSSITIHTQSRLPRNYGMVRHLKGSETPDIRNRCRWIQGLCATGRKDQSRTLPILHYLNHHNCVSIQTCLIAVHSVSVALINRLPEKAIAVIVNPEAAANFQNGMCSSTYR